jgi:5-methylcytosine-specific restriction endonuclease McrA
MPARNGTWNGMNWIRQAKRQALYDRDGHKCIYCGRNGDDSKLTLDHLIPIELGGTNAAKNLVTCCLTCNSTKSSKTLKQFMEVLRLADGIDTVEMRKRIRRHVRRKLKNYKEKIPCQKNP